MQDRVLWGSIASAPSSGAINLGDFYQQANNKLLLTWRMLPGDDENTGFDLYRKIGNGNEYQVNRKAVLSGGLHYEVTPICATNYTETSSNVLSGDNDVTYRLTLTGSDETVGTYTIKKEQIKNKLPWQRL